MVVIHYIARVLVWRTGESRQKSEDNILRIGLLKVNKREKKGLTEQSVSGIEREKVASETEEYRKDKRQGMSALKAIGRTQT